MVAFSALSYGVGPILYTVNVNNIFATGITIRVEIDGDSYGPYSPGETAMIFVTPGSVAQVWSITENLYLQFDQAG